MSTLQPFESLATLVAKDPTKYLLYLRSKLLYGQVQQCNIALGPSNRNQAPHSGIGVSVGGCSAGASVEGAVVRADTLPKAQVGLDAFHLLN